MAYTLTALEAYAYPVRCPFGETIKLPKLTGTFLKLYFNECISFWSLKHHSPQVENAEKSISQLEFILWSIR